MKTDIYTEIDSILIALKGSPWASNPTILTIIQEYGRFVEASKNIHHIEQKPALQILFSSRAIDTLLKYIVNKDLVAHGKKPKNFINIGASLKYIEPFIDPIILHDLSINVKNKRNGYLHEAGIFPTETELEKFLHSTAIGISELINKLP